MKNHKYTSAVEGILKASTDEALNHVREIRSSEDSSAIKILEQKLISFRLALKIGNGRFLEESELNPKVALSDLLKAEVYFVRGMILVHKPSLCAAAKEFATAALYYLSVENHEKALLSEFNALIAESNGGLLSAQKELNRCNEIHLKAKEKSVFKIQALCLRQKSYCYYTSGRALAAHNEIKEALPLLEAHSPVSDYHLALIHAADCALEAHLFDLAKVYLDYLPSQVDSRIDFPLAYVKAKIEGSLLDLSLFEEVNSHWKNRYEDYLERQNKTVTNEKAIIFWNSKTFYLVTDRKQILGKIKPQSLEGLLIKMLMKGPQSKELLSEALWPEFSSSENLDDRFFRLKTRINQKLGSLINFDGQNYSLAALINWTK